MYLYQWIHHILTKWLYRKLRELFSQHIDFVFHKCRKVFIKVSADGKAFLRVKKLKVVLGILVTRSLKTVVEYLIENDFFTLVNITIKQDINISMGVDPSLFLAIYFVFLWKSIHDRTYFKQ